MGAEMWELGLLSCRQSGRHSILCAPCECSLAGGLAPHRFVLCCSSLVQLPGCPFRHVSWPCIVSPTPHPICTLPHLAPVQAAASGQNKMKLLAAQRRIEAARRRLRTGEWAGVGGRGGGRPAQIAGIISCPPCVSAFAPGCLAPCPNAPHPLGSKTLHDGHMSGCTCLPARLPAQYRWSPSPPQPSPSLQPSWSWRPSRRRQHRGRLPHRSAACGWAPASR